MAVGVHIIGSRGRMGQALIRLAEASDDFQVVGQADEGDDLIGPIDQADAVIDFSHHSIGAMIAEETAKRGKALVVGATGHSDEDRARILGQQKSIPLILASNCAIGVNALFYLTRKAAEILGPEYDREITEMHHRFKKDAPSGTARTLAEMICEADGLQYNKVAQHGREGEPGERTATEIGIHALRGGDVVGEHTVYFAGMGERVELTVRSSNRDSYASGALRAAQWLQGKAPGAYSMFDVLGLS
jgi:4-hydroxy-tetrahydrodipicolinate reductase